ncbi:MAG: hypothetical protein ACWGPS_04320 [Candidatus Promineifilaceae bacterium]
MLDNVALLGLVIIILWLTAIGYYFFVSRQQRELSEEIDEVRRLLAEDAEDEEPTR